MLHKMLEVRKKYGKNHFLDIGYEQLVNFPVETAYQIYNHFDLKPSKHAAEGMRNWLHENPKNKLGEHIYTPESYGLNKRVLSQLPDNNFDVFSVYY